MTRRPQPLGELLPGVLADLARHHGHHPPTTLTDRTPMTDRARADIRLDGRTGTVVVDGHDLSHAVHGLTLRAGVDQLPELELDLVIPTAQVEGEAELRVYMPDETKKALIALGWTPPAGEEAGDAA